MAVLVYLVRLFITAVVGESVTPSGPLHTVFTVTGTSTVGLNTTVQVRVTVDPIGRMGLEMLLVTIMVGGTIKIQSPFTLIFNLIMLTLNIDHGVCC